MADRSSELTVRHLTADDLDEAARVFVTSLGAPPRDDGGERYGHYWDVEDSLAAVDRDGRILGVAATSGADFTVEGGVALPCAAVPSVGVRPDSHGRGVGRALLEQQVSDAVDRGAALMALNASESAIYGRYGYGPTSRWWATKVRPQTLAWRDDAPQAVPGSITELDDLDEVPDVVGGLHERVFGSWAGELSRPAGWWWAVTHPRPDDKPPTWAVHRDAGGQVDAALAYKIKLEFDDVGFANEAEIVDVVAADPRTAAIMWRWLLDRRLLAKVTRERTDPRLPVSLMLREPRRFMTRYDADAAWVRILDVQRVLSARTTDGSGRVAVRVVDPLVAANDRTWSVVGEEGVLAVTPTQDEPEATVPIDLLAPLAWGFVRLSTLVAAGRVPSASADVVGRLEHLLATRAPAWCSTGF